MNKGDKVRIKNSSDSLWDGFEAEIVSPDDRIGPWLKPLSDRPDGYARSEFSWTASDLELVPEEKTFNVGDKVRVVRDTVSWGGVTITAGTVGVVKMVDWCDDFILVDDLVGVSGDRGIKFNALKLVTEEPEEKQTIEVGDTVKATHVESGSVVQGVVKYLETGDGGVENVEFETAAHEDIFADLYADGGWEFELIAKKEVPKPAPKVGDPWEVGLPVGTVAREDENSYSILHTGKGWVRQDGYTFLTDGHNLEGLATIVYLPPTE